ncbi:hypothetical protein [Desertivirga arenae]|uniref:hypothetical protein n=1 Tax=Desertivirga arenae TaxID=2810309 RepID=UPI001A978794|nr:hypothetical protein [Pedobacter sp. SYSU D00823]
MIYQGKREYSVAFKSNTYHVVQWDTLHLVFQIWLNGEMLVTIQKDEIWKSSSMSKINLSDAFAIALILEGQLSNLLESEKEKKSLK